MAQRTALVELKTQKALTQEQDQLLTDNDADWTEDDLESEEGVRQSINVFQASPGRRLDPHGKEKTSARGGPSKSVNHLARCLSTGLEDLQSRTGRCVALASVLFPD